MSQAIHTPPPRGATREPAAGYRLTASPSQILKRSVRFLTSMRLALVLLLALALLTLAGTLLVQAPADVRSDPQSYATWLDSVRPKYGGWTAVFDRLGLFSVFSSIWFEGTMVLLSASLLVCSVRRTPRLWRQAYRPPMIMRDAFFDRVPHRATFASQADPDTALAKVRAVFRGHHFRTATEADGDAVHVRADRFRWGPMGRIAAHLGFVVILIGAVIGTTWGFRNEQLAVPVGTKVDVGNGTGMAVEAKAFSDSYYTSGEPRDYRSEIVLYENGRRVRAGPLRVNHPMRYRGVTFYQSFFGNAAVIRVKARNGRILFDGSVPLLWGSKDGKHNIGRFSLPEQGLTVFVVGPPSGPSGQADPGIAGGQMQLEVYRAGTETPMAVRSVSQRKPAKLAGLDFRFARERQFTGLIVARDPGSKLVWIGSTLLVLGISSVLLFPRRRIRAVIRPRDHGSEARVAAVGGRRDVEFDAQFQRLVDDIELALGRAGAT